MPASYRKYLVALVLLSLPLFFLNVHDRHSWGDDFSLYINEARNIGQGRPFYQNTWIFNKYNTVYSPPQYPPGFPLLLAPVVRIWGLAFRPMLLFISLLSVCVMLAAFTYFTRKGFSAAVATCLAVLLAYGGYFLELKGNVLADIPCLLFVTLYLACRLGERFTARRILLLVLLAVIAIQMRSQAIFILAAEALTWAVILVRSLPQGMRKVKQAAMRQPSLYIIAGVIMADLLLDKLIFPTPANTVDFYNGFLHNALHGDIFVRAKENIHYVFRLITGSFHYHRGAGPAAAAVHYIEDAGGVLALACFVINVWSRPAFEDMFFGVMCLLVLYYPVQDPRYFLPALPILYGYSASSLQKIVSCIPRLSFNICMGVITVVYLALSSGSIIQFLHEPPGLMPASNGLQAFHYISTHVSDTDVIVYDKPRVLALFTGKHTICPSYESCEVNRKIFEEYHAHYMLVIHGFCDSFFMQYLRRVQPPADSVNIADSYTLYRLN